MKAFFIFIAVVSVLILLSLMDNLTRDIKHLQVRDTMFLDRLECLEATVELNSLKIDKVVPGVREALRPFTKIIPIDRATKIYKEADKLLERR